MIWSVGVTSQKVNIGIHLYEASIALWNPYPSNCMNERVAIWISSPNSLGFYVLGRVSGGLANEWTVTCDDGNHQLGPLNSSTVEPGIRLFGE